MSASTKCADVRKRMTDDCEIPMRRWRDLPSAPSKRAGAPKPCVELVNSELGHQRNINEIQRIMWQNRREVTPRPSFDAVVEVVAACRWRLKFSGSAFCLGSPGDLSFCSALLRRVAQMDVFNENPL